MRYVSIFSGIEAASAAWLPLGWEPVAFAEIEPFCCDLLAKRFPDVPNLGDVREIDWSPYADAVDVVIGGSPCQSFSVAGNRQGLMDERGALMLEYIRAVRDIRPQWLIWENVSGVLSQDGGRAFETLVKGLEECGYCVAYRVLDAQFFGVAQRRRRVFLVGHPRIGCAAAVLFERQSLRWDSASSREKREALARAASKGACYAVQTGHTSANGSNISDDVSPTLDCAGPCAVCLGDDNANASIDHDLCGTLKVGGMPPSISNGGVVRRLTPTECERLQGFSDGWTQLGGTNDTPRYRALGNSMAVPVIRWLGERIQKIT